MQTKKPIRNNTDTVINSYEGHVFIVKFFDKKIKGQAEFAKLAEAETLSVFYNPVDGFKLKQTTKFDEMVDKVDEALAQCTDESTRNSCIAEKVMGEYLEGQRKSDQLKKYRDKISSRLRNYTCADPLMESSKPIGTHSVRVGGKAFVVNDLFENSHAKIWTIENFLTDEECSVLKNHGKPRLTRATVAAEDGTSVVSNHRKANQATYDRHRHADDPLHGLYNRILDVTNQKTDMGLTPPGQEGFTIIQYDKGDEYL